MASKITFTGVQLHTWAGKRDPKSGNTVTVMEFTANWTKAVREKMGWEDLMDLPESLRSGKLKGQLIAVDMELVPSDGKVAKHRIGFPIKTVGTFGAARTQITERSSTVELSFKVVTVAEEASAAAAAYKTALGDAPGTMKVSYTEQLAFGEQPDTPPEPDPEEDED